MPWHDLSQILNANEQSVLASISQMLSVPSDSTGCFLAHADVKHKSILAGNKDIGIIYKDGIGFPSLKIAFHRQ